MSPRVGQLQPQHALLEMQRATAAFTSFQKDALKAHNRYRAMHGAPPLKLSVDLNKYAQEWADHLAQSGTFQHREDDKFKGEYFGENIANRWSSHGADLDGKSATKMWYDEVADYKAEYYGSSTPPSGPVTGHFTQVIWKESRELGIGKAFNPDGTVVVVANYTPAGNMRGMFHKNVMSPAANSLEVEM